MSRLVKSRLWQRAFRVRAEDELPHAVTHQRIYIVPSKRGCAFLFTLLLMLIGSINYSLSLGYALCFLLTGLFAATLLHTYRNVAGIGISAIQARDTFCFESADFMITLCNELTRARHGICLRTTDSTNSAVRVRLTEQNTQTITLSVDTKTRGVCKLGRLTLQSDWPLGLWTCWSYLHVDRQALVFPAPEQQAPAPPIEAGDEQGTLARTTTTGDVAGLREYQPGDSMGSIAWKSAARGLGLMSRTFDNDETSSAIVLDLQHAAVSGIEAKLSRLCAWVLTAEADQTDYAVRLSGFALDKGRGTQQKAEALKALALFGHGVQPDTPAL